MPAEEGDPIEYLGVLLHVAGVDDAILGRLALGEP